LTLGRYLIGVVLVTVGVAPLAAGARAARRRLLPGWSGGAACIAAVVIAVASELLATEALGFASLLYPLPLAIAWAAAGFALCRWGRRAESRPVEGPAPPAAPRERPGARALALAAVVVLAAQWGALTISALRHGPLGSDTLRYHEPVAARFVQQHSIDHLHFLAGDPVNTFLPFNSELLHSAGILFMGSDVLSPLFNIAWLGLALGAAWTLGRSRGLGAPVLLAVALLPAAPNLAASQPGSGNNDIVGAALVLTAMALALEPRRSIPGLGLAGVAAGLAVGTKPTFAVTTLVLGAAIAACAPAGARRRAWALVAAGLVAGGGAWYLRNLILVGNPVPWWHIHLGPLDLPAPARPPGTTLAHYATSFKVWSDVLVPELDDALGPLWWGIGGLAALGAVLAIAAPGRRALRWFGAAGVVAAIAYALTPNTADGPEGFPIFFEFTVRYAAGALAIGLALAPLSRPAERVARSGWTLAVLAAALVVTVAAGTVDGRTVLLLAVGAAMVIGRRVQHALRRPLAAAAAGAAAVALGWAVTSNYLDGRYTSGPYAWANGLHHERIAVAGSTKQYQLYGRDLSNRVQYMGRRGAHGAFGPIASCAEWRRELRSGRYRYVVITPPELLGAFSSVTTREARWTASDPHAVPVLHPAPRIVVFRLDPPRTERGC
jgi:hypothetical protein